MSLTAKDSTSNKLLRALPPGDFAQLKPYLEPVAFRFRQVLHYAADPVNSIYFPENAVISNINMLEGGESLETGIIGNEGMTGFATFFAQNHSPCETVVQMPGSGWRIRAKDFRRIVGANGRLPAPVLAFINTYTEQSTQWAICATYHSLAKRMVKRFLMYQDRAAGNAVLQMNHESIALMLGVTRGSVTMAANELKDLCLIRYSRGKIELLDRKGLENFTCECYAAVKRAYDNYLLQIELKDLTRRVERSRREYDEVIRQRQDTARETEESIEEFRRVKNEQVPLLIKICARCQRICDLQYHPREIPESFQRLLRVMSSSGICTSCASKQELFRSL